jgi:hypothetical protein
LRRRRRRRRRRRELKALRRQPNPPGTQPAAACILGASHHPDSCVLSAKFSAKNAEELRRQTNPPGTFPRGGPCVPCATSGVDVSPTVCRRPPQSATRAWYSNTHSSGTQSAGWQRGWHTQGTRKAHARHTGRLRAQNSPARLVRRSIKARRTGHAWTRALTGRMKAPFAWHAVRQKAPHRGAPGQLGCECASGLPP